MTRIGDQTTVRLARRILRTQTEDGLRGRAFPCERKMAESLGTTRHAVRKALHWLETEGHVVRLSRRASVPAAVMPVRSAGIGLEIRCITFLRAPSLAAEPLRWLAEDHLAGYTEALEAHDIKTRFVICPDDFSDGESLLWSHVPYREQACVLVSRAMPRLLNWLDQQKVPFVVQYNHAYALEGLPDHHSAIINKAGGGYEAVRHLMDLGHRHIGFVGVNAAGAANIDVFEGFQAAMKTHALPIRPEFLCDAHTDVISEAMGPVRAFLQRPVLPTALVTENDTLAFAVLRAARERSLRVPGDLSVVGFNNQAEAAVSDPPLTTMRTPRRELARAAVEMLLEACASPSSAYRQRVLDCELIVRGTTAKPGKSVSSEK